MTTSVLVDNWTSPVMATANQKGGVGKTSLTANLAGLAAAAGWRTLVIDLDPQGNLGRDLGYWGTAVDDRGRGMFEALAAGGRVALEPARDVRPNLDVIVGGEEIEAVHDFALSRLRMERPADTLLHDALQPLLPEYNLVLIDTPPRNRVLQRLALTASRFALIPTKTDYASLDGISEYATKFAEVRAVNPALELLGVVLFGVNPSATRVLNETREQTAAGLGRDDLVFTTTIRHAEAPSRGARNAGLLAYEYAEAARTAPKFYEPGGREHSMVNGDKLATDYADLAQEVLGRLSHRLNDASHTGASSRREAHA